MAAWGSSFGGAFGAVWGAASDSEVTPPFDPPLSVPSFGGGGGFRDYPRPRGEPAPRKLPSRSEHNDDEEIEIAMTAVTIIKAIL